MIASTLLRTLCLPTVVLVCSVCPSAAATPNFDLRSALCTELAERYFGSPQWPTLYNFLSEMEKSGNVNRTDRSGDTLLGYCLRELPSCDARLVQQLLLAGLDPNRPEPATGLTPLHRAALVGNYRLALRLLAFGADVRAKDKNGRTPAELTEHPRLRDLLLGKHPGELRSERAIAAWKKACSGDVAAMWEIAGYYNDDIGEDATYFGEWATDEEGDPDELEKFSWVEQAAARGYAKAQFDLGMRKVFSRGVPEDISGGYALIAAAQAGGLEAAGDFIRENPEPGAVNNLVAPEELGNCTITLTGRRKGWRNSSTFKMGYGTSMPRLNIISWNPKNRLVEISFESAGETTTVRFSGTAWLTDTCEETYTFKAQGEMTGRDGRKFTATSEQMIITINPEP